MMKVSIEHSFRHASQQYHEGELRITSDEEGKYFCDCGWARDVTGEVATASIADKSDVTLVVQNSKVGHSGKVPGG